MKKGLFIVIEGLDGSGSTTQCELLKSFLQSKGQRVLLTKEPTNNLIGGLIRGVLTGDWQITPEGLQLLFCADRAHHLQKEIVPALEKGMHVICDRYMYSTLAFGAVDCGLKWLQVLNEKFLQPDLAFVLEVPPEICIRRIAAGRNRFELFEKEDKLRKVLANYKEIALQYNLNFVDGQKSKDTVHQEINKKVNELLNKN